MRRLPVLLLLIGTATVAACSDDGGDRLSQEEFVEQANGICEAGNERIDAVFEDAFPDPEAEPDPEEIEAVIEDEFLPAIQQQIDELDELNPPEDVEEDFDALLDDARSAVEEFGELSGEELLGQEEGDDPFAEINEQADELGLTACAE